MNITLKNASLVVVAGMIWGYGLTRAAQHYEIDGENFPEQPGYYDEGIFLETGIVLVSGPEGEVPQILMEKLDNKKGETYEKL